MNIVKVSILIFLLSVLFVGLVYDYGTYQQRTKEEFRIYTEEMVSFEKECNKDFNSCVDEAERKCAGQGDSYACLFWSLPSGPWIYMVNGYRIEAYSISAYGCEKIHLIYRTNIEAWKTENDKSYWKGLAKRLSVMEVSADETGIDYKNDLNISNISEIINLTQWYYMGIASDIGMNGETIKHLTSTYYDDEGNEYKIILVKVPRDVIRGKEVNISQYYSTSPPEEEYKWSDDDLNISQWDDEYPPKEPKLTELDGNWTDVNESLYNADILINDGRDTTQQKWVDYPMDDTEILKEMERNRLRPNTIRIILGMVAIITGADAMYLLRRGGFR